MNRTDFDVAIIGAGPAGMAAALSATGAGARVVMIDSSPRIGGQFWRHGPNDADSLTPMHTWRAKFVELSGGLTEPLVSGALTHLPSTSVWMAEAGSGGFILHLAAEGGAAGGTVQAAALIVATGAYDRQLPIPGWDLPGVMAAGGVQGFIKQSGFSPAKRYVIAGTGPFLLPVALNVLQAGAQVAGVFESSGLAGWGKHLHRAARVPSKLVEGAGYSFRLAARRVSYRTRTVVTEILGQERVEAVRVGRVDAQGNVRSGTEKVIDGIDGVGLGWGFTPQLDLAVQLGAATAMGADGSLVAVADEACGSSVPGVFLAGEVSGVGGATLAVAQGFRAGESAAAFALSRNAPAVRGWAANNHREFARAMHSIHRVPPAWRTWLPDPCLVCRCEEVTAGAIRTARDQLGAADQRTNKGATRAGMGWCQGRVCGYAVSSLAEDGAPSAESLRRAVRRPVARPVPLSVISRLGEDQTPK